MLLHCGSREIQTSENQLNQFRSHCCINQNFFDSFAKPSEKAAVRSVHLRKLRIASH